MAAMIFPEKHQSRPWAAPTKKGHRFRWPFPLSVHAMSGRDCPVASVLGEFIPF